MFLFGKMENANASYFPRTINIKSIKNRTILAKNTNLLANKKNVTF